MTVQAITIHCDTPDCYAHCTVESPTVGRARERAFERWGWTYRPGAPDTDTCGPCERGDTPDSQESP